MDEYHDGFHEGYAKGREDAGNAIPTLRYQFAMAALRSGFYCYMPSNDYDPDEETARACYRVADAMLKARED